MWALPIPEKPKAAKCVKQPPRYYLAGLTWIVLASGNRYASLPCNPLLCLLILSAVLLSALLIAGVVGE
jgi:hypothetical protein